MGHLICTAVCLDGDGGGQPVLPRRGSRHLWQSRGRCRSRVFSQVQCTYKTLDMQPKLEQLIFAQGNYFFPNTGKLKAVEDKPILHCF